ncbi:hypothetical protein DHW03_02410 [Pedobacter yonginense]|uniref:Uncharacterized protein n=1 Tax=Pedobacter yonginense TaxID=651869 RepID=A0A317ERH8_9SPHI|nr:hypothetical protein [Pedobacter yonginense]PWS28717.1 hypothetical protein DHW03_02410 [Pedobacter yonginense]
MEHLAQAIEQETRKRLYERNEALMFSLRNYISFAKSDLEAKVEFDCERAIETFQQKVEEFKQLLQNTHSEVKAEMLSRKSSI